MIQSFQLKNNSSHNNTRNKQQDVIFNSQLVVWFSSVVLFIHNHSCYSLKLSQARIRLVDYFVENTHRGCYSEKSPLCGCPGRNTPWTDNDILGHTLWCHPGPSCPADSPHGRPQVGHSLTSCPQAGRCICYMGSTGSHWVDTADGSYTGPTFCFSLHVGNNNYFQHNIKCSWCFCSAWGQ